VLWSHLGDTLIRKKIDERKNYISMVLHLLTKLLLGNTKFLGGMENLQLFCKGTVSWRTQTFFK